MALTGLLTSPRPRRIRATAFGITANPSGLTRVRHLGEGRVGFEPTTSGSPVQQKNCCECHKHDTFIRALPVELPPQVLTEVPVNRQLYFFNQKKNFAITSLLPYRLQFHERFMQLIVVRDRIVLNCFCSRIDVVEILLTVRQMGVDACQKLDHF